LQANMSPMRIHVSGKHDVTMYVKTRHLSCNSTGPYTKVENPNAWFRHTQSHNMVWTVTVKCSENWFGLLCLSMVCLNFHSVIV
jgi:hypothetical protein